MYLAFKIEEFYYFITKTETCLINFT